MTQEEEEDLKYEKLVAEAESRERDLAEQED